MPRFWSYVRRANLVDALAVIKPRSNLIGALQRELPTNQVAVKGATIDHTETKDNHAFTDGVLHWWRVEDQRQQVSGVGPGSADHPRLHVQLSGS